MGFAVAVAIVFVIVFAAGRFVLGAFMPAGTMARVDRGFRRAGHVYLKAIVVLAAAFAVAVVVATAFRG